MRASEESTEQRLDRWQQLRDRLRDFGLDKDPSEGLLLKQEATTRPDVPLVPTAPIPVVPGRPDNGPGGIPPRASPSAQPPRRHHPADSRVLADSPEGPHAIAARKSALRHHATAASRFRRIQPTRSGCGTGWLNR